jgi:hypothetical protein
MAKSPGDLDAYITSAATLMGLALLPEWLPTVRANLEVIMRLAAQVEAFELPDDAEPASVFKA